MRHSNVTRFDSKGRLLIPSHIRKKLKAEEGTDVVIIPDDEKRNVKIIPLVKGRTAEIRFLLEDVPGSLSKVANLLSQSDLDIILSESKTLTKGKLAEWDVMVDVSGCDDLEELKKKALKLDDVKKVEILRDGSPEKKGI